VKANVQINSVADKGVVSKLSYKVKGLFTITANLGHHSFEVQPYGDTKAAKHKYKNTELYLLPPSLFPVHLLDTMDKRYLNIKFAPIVNPLKRSLKIELYNEKYLREKGEKIKTYSKINDKPLSLVDNLAFHPHPDTSYLLTGEIHQEYDTKPDTIESVLSAQLLPADQISQPSLTHLRKAVIKSADRLFSIAYTPSGPMTSRWYLV